ncbi:MAG: hypothetical protein A4E28_00210 [Methanocella sp. PtaU1.Bin125]|nr:MAG: hypothetical protein A4E28_00210 [Methanocella sp. PtaU1.Bin125]
MRFRNNIPNSIVMPETSEHSMKRIIIIDASLIKKSLLSPDVP